MGWDTVHVNKGPNTKLLVLWPCNLCHNFLTLLLLCKSSHKQYINQGALLCSNKTLLTVKFDFLIFCVCHEILVFLLFLPFCRWWTRFISQAKVDQHIISSSRIVVRP